MNRISALTALALVACAQASANLPGDAAILPGNSVAMLLGQCSRASPQPGEGSWQPGAQEIAALEAALPAALGARPRQPYDPDWSQAPNGWRRQYVGIVRGGRRFVYGNFFPSEATRYGEDRQRWRREPVIVCDGGPVFFGAEYDVEARRITHLAFNGMA